MRNYSRTVLIENASLNVQIIIIQAMVNIFVYMNVINIIQENSVSINVNLDSMVMRIIFAPYVLPIAKNVQQSIIALLVMPILY